MDVSKLSPRWPFHPGNISPAIAHGVLAPEDELLLSEGDLLSWPCAVHKSDAQDVIDVLKVDAAVESSSRYPQGSLASTGDIGGLFLAERQLQLKRYSFAMSAEVKFSLAQLELLPYHGDMVDVLHAAMDKWSQ